MLCGRTWTWHGHFALTQAIAGWQWVRLAHVEAPRDVVLLKISANAEEHDAVSALRRSRLRGQLRKQSGEIQKMLAR